MRPSKATLTPVVASGAVTDATRSPGFALATGAEAQNAHAAIANARAGLRRTLGMEGPPRCSCLPPQTTCPGPANRGALITQPSANRLRALTHALGKYRLTVSES